jgi:hypothetical protein
MPTLRIPPCLDLHYLVDETRAWQPPIPDSELLVLPGDADHVAASHAAQCVQATLAFIEGRDPDDGR